MTEKYEWGKIIVKRNKELSFYDNMSKIKVLQNRYTVSSAEFIILKSLCISGYKTIGETSGGCTGEAVMLSEPADKQILLIHNTEYYDEGNKIIYKGLKPSVLEKSVW